MLNFWEVNEDLKVYANDGVHLFCIHFTWLEMCFLFFICVYYSGRILICLKPDTML